MLQIKEKCSNTWMHRDQSCRYEIVDWSIYSILLCNIKFILNRILINPFFFTIFTILYLVLFHYRLLSRWKRIMNQILMEEKGDPSFVDDTRANYMYMSRVCLFYFITRSWQILCVRNVNTWDDIFTFLCLFAEPIWISTTFQKMTWRIFQHFYHPCIREIYRALYHL